MDKRLISRLAFWQKKATSIDLGVYVCTDKLWVYAPATDEQAEKWLSFELQNEQWQTAFAALAHTFPNARLQIVLVSSCYQLLVADKPNVNAEELPQALLWSIKDMVTIPVPQIHLDYFEPPLPSNKISVVVVTKDYLVNLVQAIHGQGLSVAGISIEELAMTNLFIDDNQARLIVSHHTGQELLLTVVKQGQLYMQRRVRGFMQLDKTDVDQLHYGLADNLSLEIQRSMDYFESQLRQAPVASIELLADGAVDVLAKLVSANFNQAVNVIDKSSVGARMAGLAFSEFSRGAE
ncbi:MSHA biogenesis protein MshI [Shewanella sp. KJ2020]|uniref:MSHA biogenesis protein MshI n=1 Tax=Shewanella sp. KJ2020 TaxID=2919172 RepID=UPI0020A7532A|nr:MSHA biogenesis protein MshI [Shewanella sp. KJ2020]MCP3128654.1 MSHA biogenesis protein MshI [Shewanella sp. KJ2020]